jgi:hypothetical protein
MSTQKPTDYVCRKTSVTFSIDGDLDKPVWRAAKKSAPFVDMVGGEPAMLETRLASLWDDENLYVGFWVSEPAVQASLTERDSFIWYDNDVEVFIDGEDCYYEFEINAFNTVYEVLFIYQDALKRGSRFDTPDFDLYTRNVDVLSGFQDPTRYNKHPRGKRWAFMDYDFPGLKTAVKVDGKINDPSHLDKGWTVELAFPWQGLQKMYASRHFPPAEGDELRANFFRFENMRFNGQHTGSAGWALAPHGIYDSHRPECFPSLRFTR